MDLSKKFGNQTHQYPRPAVTIDTVALRWDKDAGLCLLTGKRNEPPFEGQWGLPGAFLREDLESPEEAVRRLLEEKTGTSPKNLTLATVRGNPNRDPRGHVVSIAYVTICSSSTPTPVAGGNFSQVAWYPLSKPLTKFAFDHREIIQEAIKKLHPIRFTENAVFNLLPREFSISWLRELCESIAPADQKYLTEPRNFHAIFRKMEKAGLVEATKETLKGSHRPAKLYERTFKPFQT